jgi:hypothetical protein
VTPNEIFFSWCFVYSISSLSLGVDAEKGMSDFVISGIAINIATMAGIAPIANTIGLTMILTGILMRSANKSWLK